MYPNTCKYCRHDSWSLNLLNIFKEEILATESFSAITNDAPLCNTGKDTSCKGHIKNEIIANCVLRNNNNNQV
jgi:hypothetical protein